MPQDAMTRLVLFALLVAAATSVGVARAGEDIRRCAFEVKARCASGDARVVLIDGAVQSIGVSVDWCALAGGLAYSCTINSSRGDRDSKWSQEGDETIISNLAPFSAGQPDFVKVTVGRHVSIDLEHAESLGRCGAGAELPWAIVIPAQRGPCRIWLER